LFIWATFKKKKNLSINVGKKFIGLHIGLYLDPWVIFSQKHLVTLIATYMSKSDIITH
jgi:hypothetical protein